MDQYLRTSKKGWQLQRQTWSAVRCNRLLRPLSAKILALRSQASSVAHGMHDVYDGPSLSIQIDNSSNLPSEKCDESESVWSQQKYRNKNKRKYGRQCRVNDRDSRKLNKRRKLDGRDEIEPERLPFATPFLQRVKRQLMNQQDEAQCPSETCQMKISAAEVTLPEIDCSNRRNAKFRPQKQGIFELFVSLMQVTASDQLEERYSQHAIKPGSLLETCIGQVPSYISYESYWRKALDPEDLTNVSAEVYDELEDLQNVSGRAASLLKLLLRAHTIEIVEESIRDGLLDYTTVVKLISWCKAHDIVVGFETFLSALTSRCCTSDLAKDVYIRRKTHNIIREPIFQQLPLPTQLKHLRLIVGNPAIGISEFSLPQFSSLWNSAILSLMRVGECQEYFEAVQLLEQFFEKTCQLERENPSLCKCTHAITNHTKSEALIQFLTAMCAVCVGHVLSLDFESSKSRVYRPIKSAVTLISGRCQRDRSCYQDFAHARASEACCMIVLLFADLLISLCDYEDENEYDEVNDSEDDHGLYANERLMHILGLCSMLHGCSTVEMEATSILASLVSLTARTIQRLTGAMNDVPLRRLIGPLQRLSSRAVNVDNMEDLDIFNTPTTQSGYDKRIQLDWFIERVTLEASMNFALDPKMPSATALIAQIERTIATNQNLKKIPASEFPSSGVSGLSANCGKQRFRWEQDICEWIVRTPVASVCRETIEHGPESRTSRLGGCKPNQNYAKGFAPITPEQDGRHGSNSSIISGVGSTTGSELDSSESEDELIVGFRLSRKNYQRVASDEAHPGSSSIASNHCKAILQDATEVGSEEAETSSSESEDTDAKLAMAEVEDESSEDELSFVFASTISRPEPKLDRALRDQ